MTRVLQIDKEIDTIRFAAGQLPDDNQPSEAEVRHQLATIAASPVFRNAPRLRPLLTFIVEESLNNRADDLTSGRLATALFGKADITDLDKTRIRVAANRLREKLDHFYASSGATDHVAIILEPGSYAAQFRYRRIEETPPISPHLDLVENVSLPFAQCNNVRPLLIVDGFKVFGASTKAEFIATSLNEELIAAFAGSSWMVVAENVDHQARSELISFPTTTPVESEFVFEGALRQQDLGLRMTARVRTKLTGEIIWRYARDWHLGELAHIDDLKHLAMEFRNEIVDGVGGVVFRRLRGQYLGPQRQHICEADPVTLYSIYTMSCTKKDYLQALNAMEKAVIRHPEDVSLLADLASLHIDGYSLAFREAELSLESAHRALEKAKSIDPSNLDVIFSSVYLSLYECDTNVTAELARKLMDLSMPTPIALMGPWLLGACGYYDEAWAGYDRWLDELVHMPNWFNYPNVVYSYEQGDYAQAYEEAKAYEMSGNFWGPLLRAASLGQLGDSHQAQLEIEHVMKRNPEFAGAPFRRLKGLSSSDDGEHLLEGVGKAGLKVQGLN